MEVLFQQVTAILETDDPDTQMCVLHVFTGSETLAWRKLLKPCPALLLDRIYKPKADESYVLQQTATARIHAKLDCLLGRGKRTYRPGLRDTDSRCWDPKKVKMHNN